VKIRSGSPQKTQLNFNLIFSGSPVPAGLAKVMLDKLPWESDAVGLLLLPSPITDITPLPRSTATERFVPPPVEQVCDRHRNKWHRTGRLLARAGYVPPVASHVFMVYVLLCWGGFFFCSQTVLQMEHSLGVKKFFFPPLSPHVKAVFFLIPCLPVLSTPLSYVCCVCMDRWMANFAGTCY